MASRKSPNRVPPSPQSSLSREFAAQLRLLQWNELDPLFAHARLQEATSKILGCLPREDKEAERWLSLLQANQYLIGFMEGLGAYRRALETLKRLKRELLDWVLQAVKESDSVDDFLAQHGQKMIPSFSDDVAHWGWLRDLRSRKPAATWNDAARKSHPKTRKALIDQFRRLKEHVAELAAADSLIRRTDALMQRRKAKVAAALRRLDKVKMMKLQAPTI